jgi:hypothetical protein
MRLKNLLLEKKSTILERWFDVILETYPAETSRFLKTQKERFANPVGHAILEGIEGVFDETLNGINPERVSPFLDNIIRIRAVQDFTPSQAISFIFLLKSVIREELKNDPEFNSGRENGIAQELLELDSKIDELAFLSFDIYMKCREKIYELRVNELKNMTFRLLQRAKLISNSEEEPNFKAVDDIVNLK